jgi:hypothetical protein
MARDLEATPAVHLVSFHENVLPLKKLIFYVSNEQVCPRGVKILVQKAHFFLCFFQKMATSPPPSQVIQFILLAYFLFA